METKLVEFESAGGKFICPVEMKEHVQKVFNGEYFSPYMKLINGQFEVIDLGANVGAFAFWMLQIFKECTVTCYEPLKSNYELLVQNLEPFKDRVTLHNVAVGDPQNTKLYHGINNCGEASFYQLGEQTLEYDEVTTIPPIELPFAQILKIDTEGSELDILNRIGILSHDFILLEYHGEQNRREIDQRLINYTLIGSEANRPDRGVLKYISNGMFNQIKISSQMR